jgi:putative DNA primase/helicase
METARDWLDEVRAEVSKYLKADAEEQEQICATMRMFGPEAEAVARQMFADAGRPTEGVSFGSEQARDDDEPPFLSKASPWDSAKEFVRRHCFQDGILTTYYWHEQFWQWNRCFYKKLSMETLNPQVWNFLDGARTGHGKDSGRFRPKPSDVEGMIKALKAGLSLHLEPPCWMDGRPANVLVFKNGLVDIETGTLSALSPKLWVHGALDFDYAPEAKCPTWERFLGEVFENDPESAECIEEQLGLGMTADIRFQKGFLWIGAKGREGKGTLAHVLEKLCGSTNYASLSFHDWLGSQYSAEVMIGKKVGVFPDVRFKPGKWYGANFDPGGIDHQSKQLLLEITGGDPVTIRQKWISVAWQGVLPMKVYLISNEIPNFNDAILVSRFIKIAFQVSFRDREDVNLAKKLEAELPGIANRCLAAYRRLCRRGKFIQPASGLKLAREVAERSNPWEAFVQDCTTIGFDRTVRPTILFWKFQDWCQENGRVDLLKSVKSPQHLSRELRKHVRELEKLKYIRPDDENGDSGPRLYVGIGLKTKADLEKEEDIPTAAITAIAPVVSVPPMVIKFKRRI